MPDSCPVWSLDDLYAGVNSPMLKADMVECQKAAKQLETEWRGRLGEGDGGIYPARMHRRRSERIVVHPPH